MVRELQLFQGIHVEQYVEQHTTVTLLYLVKGWFCVLETMHDSLLVRCVCHYCGPKTYPARANTSCACGR